MSPFRAFGTPQVPISNLERRIRYQEAALDQARQDLRAARAREGLPLEIDPLEDLAGLTEGESRSRRAGCRRRFGIR